LTGQSLQATAGTALGESEVAADGSWKALQTPASAVRHGVVSVGVPAASGALVTVVPQAR
jgi:hypothetical protein